MRVDIEIILSVLSFSVLAKVIPNGDSHGPLLVRRAVGPDTMDLLWKRNNGDGEQGPILPDSEAGAEAKTGASSDDSSPNHPSGSSAFSRVYRTPYFIEGPHWFFQEQLLPHRPRHILDSDEKSIKTVIRKVTEEFEDENRNEFISQIDILLTHVLNSLRMFLDSYGSKINTPFFLIIPKDINQQSLTKRMDDTREYGKAIVKEFLRIVEKYISRIIKKPQHVVRELDRIVNNAAHMRISTSNRYYEYYRGLFSEVETIENREHVEVTKDYIRQMNSDRDLAMKVLKKIEGMVSDDMIKRKPIVIKVVPLDVNNLLGITDGPPTGTTTEQETVPVRK
ncbi:hypothetical protein BASA50_001042 [Batrachochytrium salamandrivorans]|uniref:Uncharacterized protein n=1 Tax=Batrachochytrium salamandrivorans TaxID=1357716 RepID=A0ABQ8ES60_9FUNG|nr:hypothetical protein BASA60_007568 [Batrachochytrium salamandrivorans]KAH6585708.1 hypothetical protein BASA50_001042 [Batrachochytrium salamandrivorans]KAH6588229.1 hypothetical protein BASA61_006038 [Batrachochytrium salamandrivorans]KAH9273955.1 hypothetical protein BASA83_003589 [Batrachochytrium salamandrivorans]